MTQTLTILIVEDGNEYLDSLGRFVPGPRYLQAHSGRQALDLLRTERVDVIYLDMRFDRVPEAWLLGDHAEVCRQHNGDPARAWKHLQNNQGLYILDALRKAGFAATPVILAYDFSREQRRLAFLRTSYPRLAWVADAVTPAEIRALIDQLVAAA
jgi:ActR/RegA family two-component response regulator